MGKMKEKFYENKDGSQEDQSEINASTPPEDDEPTPKLNVKEKIKKIIRQLNKQLCAIETQERERRDSRDQVYRKYYSDMKFDK